jgi:hypothetical protein
VPADSTDTTKKDSSLALNIQQKLLQSVSNVKTGSFIKTELKNVVFKNEAEITTENLG